MTVSDILKIAGTVAVVQAICDLLARRWIFSSEIYDHQIRALRRANGLFDKAAASSTVATNKDKAAKKLAKAEEERAACAADVARRHASPQIFTSIIFLLLWKILGVEYAGKVVAVLPFQPFGLLQRLTLRGLEISEELLDLPKTAVADAAGRMVVHVEVLTQACSFAFIYVLCSASAKFIVHQLMGQKPPSGAGGGFGDMLGDARVQRSMRSLGFDVEELKKNM